MVSAELRPLAVDNGDHGGFLFIITPLPSALLLFSVAPCTAMWGCITSAGLLTRS